MSLTQGKGLRPFPCNPIPAERDAMGREIRAWPISLPPTPSLREGEQE